MRTMNKKLIIALCDSIREHNRIASNPHTDLIPFSTDQIETIADFIAASNPNFKRERFMGYIAGECGPNGGDIKPARHEYVGLGNTICDSCGHTLNNPIHIRNKR